jgi:hypothetical protein
MWTEKEKTPPCRWQMHALFAYPNCTQDAKCLRWAMTFAGIVDPADG